MMGITILSDRRALKRGETLIEIMASIMVLSIGLVGVLAAIPFGGFRMSQMTEADNSAAVGRNAVRTIRVNGWGNPTSWLVYNPTVADRDLAYISVPNPLQPTKNLLSHFIKDGNEYKYSSLDISYPIIIDPLSIMTRSRNYYPYSSSFTPDGACPVAFMHVSPLPVEIDGVSWNMNTVYFSRLPDWYEHIFYQQDDLISGFYASEDETEFRPRLETEGKLLLDGDTPEVSSFSGRYSWLAFIYPKSSSTNIDDIRFSNDSDPSERFSSVVSADFDAVVLRDRFDNDERAFAATVDGSGYQGGSVTIDLRTCRDYKNDLANSPDDYSRIREQLAQTRYIMLAGADDFQKASSGGTVYPTFARWYKIANFAKGDDEHHIRLTLIGANTPANWGNRGSVITAIFYPNVIGVYSGSATF